MQAGRPLLLKQWIASTHASKRSPHSRKGRQCVLFFEKVLIDIEIHRDIENELSTYSAKLKSMTGILEPGK